MHTDLIFDPTNQKLWLRPCSELKKRKRGRPGKSEIRAVVGVEGGNAVVKDIVVFKEVVEDRDKEILKEDVNLEALASVEDPYDVELLRRTENLKTEEEVLGYLGEINGKWGTWRRKKKIVEASEFGDALPKGWKLLVSIRKKQGRVWLFVSRYMRYFSVLLWFALNYTVFGF